MSLIKLVLFRSIQWLMPFLNVVLSLNMLSYQAISLIKASCIQYVVTLLTIVLQQKLDMMILPNFPHPNYKLPQEKKIKETFFFVHLFDIFLI